MGIESSIMLVNKYQNTEIAVLLYPTSVSILLARWILGEIIIVDKSTSLGVADRYTRL